MAKVSLSMNRAWFYCPGCKEQHCYLIKAPKNKPDMDTWEWNENVESPTFKPSLLCHAPDNKVRCHLYITDGVIDFLSDCPHELAGKKVPMADIEDGL